jgi:Nif-specific regulatory protein
MAHKKGLFEEAHAGTFFLDEIGELPTTLQVKFLRALQEGEVRPLGSNHATTADVRVLAATNRDLGQLMQQGKFREDLFYRLNVIPVVLPPLRERREDIPALAEHFLRQNSQKQGRPLHLSADAVDKLLRYPWPGNVRELENAMERTAILAQNDVIAVNDLPPHIVAGTPLGGAPALPQTLTLAEVERLHILQMLERFGWSHSRAAEALGIGRTSLWRKLKEYRIEERIRQGDSTPPGADSNAGPGR